MPAIIETKLLSFSQLAALFNKRFDRVLTKEQDAGLTYDALVMVWKQLDLLPTADVSETTTLAVINFIKGGGGMYMDKQPGQGAKVELGTASSQAVIEHTVRHEIGHGVHAQLAPVVDHWLQYDIGMWYGQVDDDGVDETRWLATGETSGYSWIARDHRRITGLLVQQLSTISHGPQRQTTIL